MEVEFTSSYPHELPIFYITAASGRFPSLEVLRELVRQECEKSLGMAMVFTMVSAIEEWLHEQLTAKASNSTRLTSCQKSPARYEEAALTLRGGPVTASSFAGWLKKFTAEQASLKAAQGGKSEGGIQKLTGRQLFEKNKALATSDITFGDDEGLVFDDEELYEGLDDLQLEEEEEEERSEDHSINQKFADMASVDSQ